MQRRLLAPLVLALALPQFALADTPAPTPRPDAPTAQERLEALIDRLMGQLEPGLDALGDMLGDLSGWHAPEVLPNGDILIRRRAQPPAPAPEEGDEPVTDPFEL